MFTLAHSSSLARTSSTVLLCTMLTLLVGTCPALSMPAMTPVAIGVAQERSVIFPNIDPEDGTYKMTCLDCLQTFVEHHHCDLSQQFGD